MLANPYARRALIPYARRAGAGLGRAFLDPRNVMLRRMARGGARYAASRIQAAWRSRRRNARRQPARARIGTPVGSARARFTQVHQDNTLILKNSRTLYVHEISDIEQGQLPNQRNRDLLNFRGVRLCLYWQNDINNRQLFVNMAVLSPKTGITIDEENFFRSNAQERGLNFEEPNLTAMDYHCRPINADKYNIITHKRFVLASPNNELNCGNLRASIRVMKYIKIKRQLRYQQLFEGPETCTTPIFFCWWCEQEGAPAESEQIPSCKIDHRIIAYFRNPRD